MLGSELVTIVIARFLLHRSLGFSALAGLAVGGPAVPFVGVSVLGYLCSAGHTIAATHIQRADATEQPFGRGMDGHTQCGTARR